MASTEFLLPEPIPGRRTKPTSLTKCSRYFARLIRFNQMDFEFAAWEMLYLFITPQRVFKNSLYRKQNKNQYARDDPAFLVLLTACLIISGIVFSIILQLNFLSFLGFVSRLLFVECIAGGIVVASLAWFYINKILGKDIEWGFAFDIHLNAFFPPMMLFQLLFFGQDIFGSILYYSFRLIAVIYYCYITYLGYKTYNEHQAKYLS